MSVAPHTTKRAASESRENPSRPKRNRYSHYLNRLIAGELSTLTRYYDKVIQWMPRPADSGLLLESLEAPYKMALRNGEELSDLTAEEETRTAILVNGTFNHHFDIQGLLLQLKTRLSHTSRVLVSR